MQPDDDNLWLRNRPRLMAMVVRFHLVSPDSVHPDRAPEWLQTQVVREAAATRRGWRHLCRELRQWANLNGEGVVDFRPIYRRFALLDFARLDRLVTLAGAVRIGRHLAKIVRSDELRRVKNAISGDLFDFARQRAGLVADELATDSLPAEMNSDAVRQLGWEQLAGCFSAADADLTDRLMLKLPSAWKLPTSPAPPATRRRAEALLRRLLVTDVQPELAQCFK